MTGGDALPAASRQTIARVCDPAAIDPIVCHVCGSPELVSWSGMAVAPSIEHSTREMPDDTRRWPGPVSLTRATIATGAVVLEPRISMRSPSRGSRGLTSAGGVESSGVIAKVAVLCPEPSMPLDPDRDGLRQDR